MTAGRTRPAAVLQLAPEPGEVLAHLPVAVLVVDSGGRVASANVAAEELLGRSEAQLQARGLPQSLMGFAGRADGVRAHSVSLALGDAPVRADINVAPLSERPGGWRVLTVAQQPAAARTPPSRAAAAIAAMLAHEVKNPLAGIRGAAQLIHAGEGADAAETRSLTALIEAEVDRVARLLDRFERLSEPGREATARINLNQVLHHVRQLARGLAPAAELREDYDPSLPMIAGDADALVQLFLNLTKNALEAVGDTGEIVFRTAFRHGARLAGRSLPIEASVEDNGPGAAPEIEGRLFEPFVSSKAAGRGLGLALVAKIADDHGAALDYLREDGRTRFRLRFATAGERAR